MYAQIEIIFPVFLVVALGYLMRRANFFGDELVDSLMKFGQNIAIPVLLFLNVSKLDLAQVYEPSLLLAFYTGAFVSFGLGFSAARYGFRRSLPDSVAVGFVAMFSNSLLLGVPITERAFGPEVLGYNFAIISLHSPIVYTVGITAMELVRAQGAGIGETLKRSVIGIFRTPLIIGILCGAALNLSGLPLPTMLADGASLLASAGLPTALFGLGGVLYRYRPEGDLRLIGLVVVFSLLVHPAIVWALGQGFGLGEGQLRAAVMTAAMAPGINAYLFANMYGTAMRVAASSVLIGTVLSAVTATAWISVLS